MSALEGEIQQYVAMKARDRVFIHAGVVGWQGRAIVLPGRTMAGKSTLVKALLAAGATYYSDEYAVLDCKARVHPYPRRLSLRRDSSAADRPRATDLGATTGTRPIPVGLVVFTEYRPRAVWRPKPLTPGRFLFELTSNAHPQVSHSDLGRKILERLAGSAAPVHSRRRRGDASGIARDILHSAEKPRSWKHWWPRFYRTS
jgi:hypothetical protein